MLEHVETHDGIEPLGHVPRIHGGQPQLGDADVRSACEALAQPAKVEGLGVREHDAVDTGLVHQEGGHVANAGADLEYAAPHPRAQPLEHPAVVAGGHGHALERRGPDRVSG